MRNGVTKIMEVLQAGLDWLYISHFHMCKWCHLVHNCQYLLAFSQSMQIIVSHFVSFPICWNKQFYDLDMCLLILLSDLTPAHSAWQKNPMNFILRKKEKKKSSKCVLFGTFLVINHICTLILNLPVLCQVTGPWEFPITEHRWSEFISIKKHHKPYVILECKNNFNSIHSCNKVMEN